MSGVSVGGAHGEEGGAQRARPSAGGHGWDGQSQDHPCTGADPQQVLTRQQSCDPQTRCFVLPDNGIRA